MREERERDKGRRREREIFYKEPETEYQLIFIAGKRTHDEFIDCVSGNISSPEY